MSDRRSDRALARLVIAARDEAAFRELYRRHTGPLLRLARRLGDEGPAEDLVHDTWIRAVERLDRFEWRSELSTWLAGILVNRAREGWRRDPRVHGAEPALDQPAPEIDVDLGLDLERAIAALPAGYRAVLVLHDVEGYRHAEIARMLAIDPGTSKSQLSRARRALRRWLDPEARTA